MRESPQSQAETGGEYFNWKNGLPHNLTGAWAAKRALTTVDCPPAAHPPARAFSINGGPEKACSCRAQKGDGQAASHPTSEGVWVDADKRNPQKANEPTSRATDRYVDPHRHDLSVHALLGARAGAALLALMQE